MSEVLLKENVLKQLKRFAWKLQYKAKKQYRREVFMGDEKWDIGRTEEIDSQLFVEELLNTLPDRERFIIRQVIIEGRTEREVAKELRISPSSPCVQSPRI